MDELKYSQNSYYPYSENFILNQPNSTGPRYFFPCQTLSSESYLPGMNNYLTRQSRKEDNRSSNSNEYVYWDDKSLRQSNLPMSKFGGNNTASKEAFLFQSTDAGEKCTHYQNTKIYNHSLPNSNMNFDYTQCVENKKTSVFDETMINQYNNMHKDRSQTHKKCMLESSYCLNSSSSLGNETTTVKESREAKCELPNSNYYEYCDDYAGLSNYFGVTSTPNISEFDLTDQQSEYSNEESDIIVEESEEENYSGVPENPNRVCSRCVVCNLIFVPQGVQFYCLTLNSPVTMTSQQPVFILLKSLVRNIRMKNNYICCECLGLLNTIDHFQTQLDNFKKEFRCKLKKTDNFGIIGNENTKIKQPRKVKHKKSLLSYYRCKYCKKTLYFKNYCHYHIMKHKSTNILCEKCGILCKNRKMFYKHICIYSKISKPPVLQPLICSNCNKFFRTKVHLKEHQNSCLGILPYICKISDCNKKFATSTRLKNHVKLKHDKKFIAICSICNIGFIKVSDYKSHKVIHSNDKKFQCQKCGKSYKTISNLNFHLKSHKQSLPFLCNICEKGFMRKEYLETHINNHKGIKNFTCTICSKKFASQKNLDSHFKYHDGSIQKKICNICGKCLTTSMNEHLRIHTNLRDYECNQCALKFNTKGTLLKHQKSKHKASNVGNFNP